LSVGQLCADSVETQTRSNTDPGQELPTCCVNLIHPLVENSNVIWVHDGLGICTWCCCFSFLRSHGCEVVLLGCVPVAISMDWCQMPGSLRVHFNHQLVEAPCLDMATMS
jgi:hypothetical protein